MWKYKEVFKIQTGEKTDFKETEEGQIGSQKKILDHDVVSHIIFYVLF